MTHREKQEAKQLHGFLCFEDDREGEKEEEGGESDPHIFLSCSSRKSFHKEATYTWFSPLLKSNKKNKKTTTKKKKIDFQASGQPAIA